MLYKSRINSQYIHFPSLISASRAILVLTTSSRTFEGLLVERRLESVRVLLSKIISSVRSSSESTCNERFCGALHSLKIEKIAIFFVLSTSIFSDRLSPGRLGSLRGNYRHRANLLISYRFLSTRGFSSILFILFFVLYNFYTKIEKNSFQYNSRARGRFSL